MADPARRLPENATGDFFVDATCIDCDTCRQVAPSVFTAGTGTPSSIVSPRPNPTAGTPRTPSCATRPGPSARSATMSPAG
jgi:hypothetical protein